MFGSSSTTSTRAGPEPFWFASTAVHHRAEAWEVPGSVGSELETLRALLYADNVPDTTEPTALADWLRLMIERESAIVGPPTQDNARRLPFGVTTLQEGLDAERTGLRLTQLLWVLVIVFLLLAVLA